MGGKQSSSRLQLPLAPLSGSALVKAMSNSTGGPNLSPDLYLLAALWEKTATGLGALERAVGGT